MPVRSGSWKNPAPKSRQAFCAVMLALLTVPGAAMAQPRPLTPAMSCIQAREIVGVEGAAVLGTGPFTYDRYVLHGGYCSYMQTTRPALVPTLDTPQCFVGYLCVDRNRLTSR